MRAPRPWIVVQVGGAGKVSKTGKVGKTRTMANRRQSADGSFAHPYSALNLRLALASFGAVTMIVLTVVLVWLRMTGLAVVAGVIAAAAVVNIVVVQRRRRQRRQRERARGDEVKHSLFE